MLFSESTEEGKYLNKYYSDKSKKARGKIDKIYKHYQWSLKQLEKINDKHTLSICILSVYDYHVNWTKQCIFDKVVKDKFFKMLENDKKRLMSLKGMRM